MLWKRWSLAARNAWVIGGLTALLCVGINTLIMVSLRDRTVVASKERVSEAAQHVVLQVKEDRLPRVVPAEEAEAIQVVNSRGEVVAATPQLAGKPPMASAPSKAGSLLTVRELCHPAGLRGCMNVASIRFDGPEGRWAVHAANLAPATLGNPALPLSLAGLSVLLTVVVATVTYRSVRRALAPFETIRAELAEITAHGIGQRVTTPTTHQEVMRLAESVNSMLDRLETALERIQRFAFEISHDLRTPITAIRLHLEEALMDPDETHWSRTATKLVEEIEKLQPVIADLAGLGAARGGQPTQPRPSRPR